MTGACGPYNLGGSATAKTHVEMLKKYRVLNGMVWASDDEFIKMIPRCAKRFFFWLSKI
jgi:hypothetical protein